MIWKSLDKREKLLLAGLAAVFLAPVVYRLVAALCDEPALTTTRPTEDAKQQPNGEMQPEEESVVNRVEQEVERIITNWCDAEAGTVRPQDSLEGLWLTKFPTSPPYNPRGITRLVTRIHNNNFFKECEAARRIRPGFFVGGGGIQTVRDLNDFLTPCGGGV